MHNAPGPYETTETELLGELCDHHVEVFTDLSACFQKICAHLNYTPPQFFLTPDWFRILIEFGFPRDVQLRIYVASAGDGIPSCILILLQHGQRLDSATNFYTINYGPIYLTEQPQNRLLALHAIAKYIAEEKPFWDVVNLRFLVLESTIERDLSTAFKTAGFWIYRYYQYDNWYATIKNKSFDDYYKKLSSRVKSTAKRKAQKLDREKNWRIILDCDGKQASIQAYLTIYQNSWKNKEPFPDFITALIRDNAAKGRLRLAILYIDEIPASAQIWLVHGGKAIIYKLAYDEQFQRFSPGTILTMYLARYVIENDGVEEIDYGVGNEPYKQDWMYAHRDIVGLEFYSKKTWNGRVNHWISIGHEIVKHHWHKICVAIRRIIDKGQPN